MPAEESSEVKGSLEYPPYKHHLPALRQSLISLQLARYARLAGWCVLASLLPLTFPGRDYRYTLPCLAFSPMLVKSGLQRLELTPKP